MHRFLRKTLLILASVLMMVSMGASTNFVNANHRSIRSQTHRYVKRSHHRSRRRSRRAGRSQRRYILSTKDLITTHNLYRLLHSGSFNYDGGTTGTVARVIRHRMIDGKRFDYIKSRNQTDNNKWIYDGELGQTSHVSTRDINLNTLQRTVTNRYIHTNKAEFLRQMKTEAYYFINRVRHQHHLSRLSERSWLDKIAHLRAHQLLHHYGHYDHSGRSMSAIDAAQLGYYPSYQQAHRHLSENISYNHVQLNSREPTDPTVYRALNGFGMAHAANNNMLNWDSHSNWGHRRNMLNSHVTSIGLGSSYNPNNRRFYLVEDFSNTPHYDNESQLRYFN